MSKFSSLEGIDLESKEIYETSDVEDELEFYNDDDIKKRDSITEEQVDIDNSRKRFEKQFVNSHASDFSDRIDRLESYETYSVKETTKNKLERIRNELAELDTELDLEDHESEELKKLKEMFYKLNKKSKDRKLISLQIEPETIEEQETVSKSYTSDPEQFQQLEEKISKLEKTIGYSFTPTSSVQSFVNDLFRKFKLLSNDQEELQRIDHLVESLNSKLEKSIAVRKNIATDKFIEEDIMIHDVYTKYQTVAELIEELPYIITRLESLNELHRDVSCSVSITEALDDQITSLKQDFDKWDKSLITLEIKLNELNLKYENSKK